MLSNLSIRLYQLNWFMNLFIVLLNGLSGNWFKVALYSLMALGWALIIQKFAGGEDLIASALFKRKDSEADHS